MQTNEEHRKLLADVDLRYAEHNGLHFAKTAPVNASMAMAEAGAAQVKGLTVTQAASIYRAMILAVDD